MRALSSSALLLMIIALSELAPAAADGPNLRGCGGPYSLDRATREAAPPDCKESGPGGTASAQIANGAVAPDERHTAAIIYTGSDGKRHICSGILIDAQHVLTAGHCACGRTESYLVSFAQAPIAQREARLESKIQGAPILFDPLTCILGPNPGDDLALLKLAEKINGINDIQFGYPSFAFVSDLRKDLTAGRELKVVGFGDTEKGAVAVRMKASIPILTADCLASPYSRFCAPFVEMILADKRGDRTSRDTCGGDSGGPVFLRKDVEMVKCQCFGDTQRSKQTEDVLVGITSRAAPFTQVFGQQHCGGGGIYTLIGRRSVYGWFAANRIVPQSCIIDRNEAPKCGNENQ
jgi:secreted trypsin-like serine protease